MSAVSARFLHQLGSFSLDVQLALDTGCTGVLGASGSGKTTLLRCIAGLTRASLGELRVQGEVWQDAHTFLPTARRRVGYVFQESSLFPHLDVLGNLRFGFARVAPSDRKLAFDDVVSLLGVGPLLARRPDALSGGERQRVAIARALLTSPSLLLLDEPLASLDPASRAQILPYLDALRRSLALPMLYVTHAPFELARLAQQVIVLERGKLQASGALNEVLTRPDLALSQHDEAGAVWSANVLRHDDTYHLTLLQVGESTLSIARRALPVGGRAFLQVRARDVSLTLSRATDTSISNVLPARVLEVCPDRDPAHRLVRLEAEGGLLLARITHFSADQLAITPGQRLFAQVKSAALIE